jgi:hypothetical protein
MRITETLIKYILKFLGYTDIEEKNLSRGQYVRQYNILSMIITGILSYTSYLKYNSYLTCDMIYNYDSEQVFFQITLLFSYFMYDIIFHKLTIEYYFHHTLGIIPVLMIVFFDVKFFPYYFLGGLITEFSSVPLALTYITSGLTKKITQIIFAITFFLVRPVFLSIILKKLLACYNDDPCYIAGLVILALLYVLNIYWFLFICRKIYRLFDQKSNKNDAIKNK